MTCLCKKLCVSLKIAAKITANHKRIETYQNISFIINKI